MATTTARSHDDTPRRLIYGVELRGEEHGTRVGCGIAPDALRIGCQVAGLPCGRARALGIQKNRGCTQRERTQLCRQGFHFGTQDELSSHTLRMPDRETKVSRN